LARKQASTETLHCHHKIKHEVLVVLSRRHRPTRNGSAVLNVSKICRPSPWFLLPIAAKRRRAAVSPPTSKAVRLHATTHMDTSDIWHM